MSNTRTFGFHPWVYSKKQPKTLNWMLIKFKIIIDLFIRALQGYDPNYWRNQF